MIALGSALVSACLLISGAHGQELDPREIVLQGLELCTVAAEDFERVDAVASQLGFRRLPPAIELSARSGEALSFGLAIHGDDGAPIVDARVYRYEDGSRGMQCWASMPAVGDLSIEAIRTLADRLGYDFQTNAAFGQQAMTRQTEHFIANIRLGPSQEDMIPCDQVDQATTDETIRAELREMCDIPSFFFHLQGLWSPTTLPIPPEEGPTP
ncbi:MAG: hypothetical protein AB7J28_00315 [Hyphomonadaceae bacterium]